MQQGGWTSSLNHTLAPGINQLCLTGTLYFVNKFAYIYRAMQFEKYKGILPEIVLARELEKRSIRQRPFCLSLQEHPQTFNAVIKGKRR